MNLVKKFQFESTRQTNDNNIRNKARLSGLKALESLCRSDSFLKRSDVGVYVNMIIPAVLMNIADTRNSFSEHSNPGQVDVKRLSIQDQLITDSELKNIGTRCISSLFASASATSLKIILASFYEVLDENYHWSNPEYILKLFIIIVEAVKKEYRYIITSSLFGRLQTEKDLSLKTTLLNVIRTLISNDNSLMGLTIPELLDTFCWHIKGMCDIKASETDLEQKPFQDSLIKAIGALSLNLNYSGQTNDILIFLVGKLEIPQNELPNDSERYFVCILESLVQTMKSSKLWSEKNENNPRRSVVLINNIGCEIYLPIITLLTDPSEGYF